jgi:hypothetical protein
MHYNQLFSEYATKNIGPRKWWRQRWVKIICVSFIVLTIFAVTLSLMLKFIILAPLETEITATTTVITPSIPVTTTLPTSLTITTASPLTTKTSVATPTAPQTTTTISTSIVTTTTTQQLGKLYSHSRFVIGAWLVTKSFHDLCG